MGFNYFKKCILCLACIGVTSLGLTPFTAVFGQTVEDLKQKIDERNQTIQQLEQEINQYRTEVDAVSKEKKTLESTVKTLDLTQKKLSSDIKVTENKISAANYTIEKLNIEIAKTENSLDNSIMSLGDILRGINENDDSNFLEVLLQNNNISDFWNQVEALDQLQKGINDRMAELRGYKAELQEKRKEHDRTKSSLVSFKEELGDKKKVVDVTKNEKASLLKTTQNKESNYKQILAEKIALRDAFEKELLAFESQLKIAIDPASYAEAKKGALAWPLDKVVITQYFGNTAFAQSGAYNGQGHNGIDFGISQGTPVKSAQSGIVRGVGDTDLVCRGASYGKWILVEHPNGLSTLYAHLSLIKVSSGQQVLLGEIIGYSGNTGYSTGPHLHFTVYATQGVQIAARKSAVCGGSYTMPIADLKAYLNPITYLQ